MRLRQVGKVKEEAAEVTEETPGEAALEIWSFKEKSEFKVKRGIRG